MSSEGDTSKEGSGSKRKFDEPIIISSDGQTSHAKINRGELIQI